MPLARIATLRLLLDTQLRKLQFVCFDPGDVAGGRVLLHQNGFKRRLRPDLFEAIAQNVAVNTPALLREA